MASKLDEMFKLIKDVLKNRYSSIMVKNIKIEDSMDNGCSVSVTVYTTLDEQMLTLEGSGVGTVDALFNAFKAHFAKSCSSLDTIELYDFNVSLTEFSAKSRIRARLAGADALCRVNLLLKNDYGALFDFESSSRSLLASAGTSVAQGVEYFINSQEAYKALHAALKDAKQRNRTDLIRRYTCQLAEVVKNTSYTKILEES